MLQSLSALCSSPPQALLQCALAVLTVMAPYTHSQLRHATDEVSRMMLSHPRHACTA